MDTRDYLRELILAKSADDNLLKDSSDDAGNLQKIAHQCIEQYFKKMRGDAWLTETYEKGGYKEEDTKIREDEIEEGFDHPNRKPDLTAEKMKEKLAKVN